MAGAFDGLFCTDEDVAVRAAGDFGQMVPKFTVVARGADGTIDAADAWLLVSACPFQQTGIGPGHVLVWRYGPNQVNAVASQIYGVVAAEPGGLRLRQLGSDDVVPGMPPDPATGVPFAAPTVRPQIQRATRDLMFMFQVASLDQLESLDDFRSACELLVYLRLLVTMAQGASNRDAWLEKYRLMKLDWDRTLEALGSIYGPATLGQDPAVVPLETVRLTLGGVHGPLTRTPRSWPATVPPAGGDWLGLPWDLP